MDQRSHASAAWRKLKAEKLKSQQQKFVPGRATPDNWCEKCGLICEDVQVHHLRYASIGNRLIVPLDDLVVLCRKCHTAAHSG